MTRRLTWYRTNEFNESAHADQGRGFAVLGVMAYLDHTWSKRFASSIDTRC